MGDQSVTQFNKSTHRMESTVEKIGDVTGTYKSGNNHTNMQELEFSGLVE